MQISLSFLAPPHATPAFRGRQRIQSVGLLCVFICHPLIICPEFTFDDYFILFALFWVKSVWSESLLSIHCAAPRLATMYPRCLELYLWGRQGKRDKRSCCIEAELSNYQRIKPQNDIDLSFTHSSLSLNFNYYLFSSS